MPQHQAREGNTADAYVNENDNAQQGGAESTVARRATARSGVR